MANTDPLSDAARKSIAKALVPFASRTIKRGIRTAGTTGFTMPSEPQLVHSLTQCVIPASGVTAPPKNPLTLLTPTGVWHHQVWSAGKPAFIAASEVGGLGSEDHEIQRWFESPVAAAVNDALDWVDEQFPGDDDLVRLMVIPAYYCHALAVIVGKKVSVVLADKPEDWKEPKHKTIYTFAEFMAALAKHKPGGTLETT
jgi:hypothetical protein